MVVAPGDQAWWPQWGLPHLIGLLERLIDYGGVLALRICACSSDS